MELIWRLPSLGPPLSSGGEGRRNSRPREAMGGEKRKKGEEEEEEEDGGATSG